MDPNYDFSTSSFINANDDGSNITFTYTFNKKDLKEFKRENDLRYLSRSKSVTIWCLITSILITSYSILLFNCIPFGMFFPVFGTFITSLVFVKTLRKETNKIQEEYVLDKLDEL